MLVYLDEALERYGREGRLTSPQALRAALEEGSVMRVRPLLMTVCTTLLGLLPLMFSGGTGSQVMKRLAAPMVGGLFSATLLTLVVLPASYMLIQRYRHREQLRTEGGDGQAGDLSPESAASPANP
jgi:Cu(I)/Ag(I) efflux system membrane protein CusA/SilA